MGVRERAHQLPRRDFVTDPEQQSGIKHIVTKGECGRLRNQITGKQRHIHPRLTLGHAIAHGGYATGDLCGMAVLG
ncbi:Uncharacterised protein [Vibrio cholerae]|uniref:Uncharacterized protein n=1 Tax=Vibrio cholerae TaxID=666 RepID=A0A655RUS0_VIBCL|nr:Uncharacterised protein [Vibrio cholerae]